jgi:5-methylcytosine-specific restriction enzyme subunit McrC
MPRRLIRVFEYETLRYPGERNGVPFTESDFHALVRFNEQHGNRYFTVVHQGVRFSHYVGVLQVGKLTLEILPKADQHSAGEESKVRWQGVLLEMLEECRLLTVHKGPQASLLTSPGSLLEVYLQSFLEEMEHLLRQGLVKQYRTTASNQDTLKGSLHFSRHLRENAVHQERFFVRHQTYDRQHPIHQLLYQALCLLPLFTTQPELAGQASRLAACFPRMPQLQVSDRTFSAIRLDRKTRSYQTALNLARLLLLGYRADVRGGEDHALSILFDMNALFEEYIYWQLKAAETDTIRVERQESTFFWAHKRVRPDILIRQLDASTGKTTNYIVDTKWKVLTRLQPDDDDLKQMYVYNQYYRAAKSVLLYPEVHQLGTMRGNFHLANPFLSQDPSGQIHGCEIRFVQVVENGRLRRNLGASLLAEMLTP